MSLFPPKSIRISISSYLMVFFLSVSYGQDVDLATKAFLKGELKESQKILEKEIMSGSANLSRYLFLSRVYYMRTQYQKSLDTLNSLLEKDGENPEGRELKGRCLFKLKKFKACLPFYEESLTETDQIELRLEWAQAFLALGLVNKGTKQLLRVASDDKPWPLAHYLLGKIRLEKGLGHWASRHFQTALKLNCQKTDIRYLLAKSFYLEGKVTGPLRLSGPYLDKSAGDMVNQRLLITRKINRKGMWMSGGSDSAIFQITLELNKLSNKASSDHFLLAALCYFDAGNVVEAQKFASKVTKISAKLSELKAKIALSKNEFKEIGQYFSEGPLPTVHVQISIILRASLKAQTLKKYKEAQHLLELAEIKQIGRADVLRAKVILFSIMKKKEEAQRSLKVLMEIHPDSPDARSLAGRYQLKLPQMDQKKKGGMLK